MAHDHATPVPSRALFMLHGVAGTGDAVPGVSPATVPVEASTSDGTEVQSVPASVPMTVPERARLAGKHWAVACRDLPEWAREPFHPLARLFDDLCHGRPRTLAEQHAYAKTRAWVHRDLTGRPARVTLTGGLIYHRAIAPPIKAVAKAVDGAADYPLRLLGLAVFVIAFLILFAITIRIL